MLIVTAYQAKFESISFVIKHNIQPLQTQKKLLNPTSANSEIDKQDKKQTQMMKIRAKYLWNDF